MTLDQVAVGTEVKIIAVGGEGQLRVRLLDMGLIPQTQVRVQKVAPWETRLRFTCGGMN